MMSWAAEKIDYETFKKPTDFIKFEQGKTTIRVVSDGYLLRRHQFKKGNTFVTLPCEGAGCPHCVKGGDPVIRYAWVILNRDTNEVKFMEAGSSIADVLIEIGKKKELKTVDIVITRRGEGKGTKYTVKEARDTEPIDDDTIELIKVWVPIYTKKYIKHV